MSGHDPRRELGLLDQIAGEALDPGYAVARSRRARRREAAEALAEYSNRPLRRRSLGPWGTRHALHLTVGIALAAAGFLGVWAALDFNADEPERAAMRSALVDRVADQTAANEELQERVEGLRAEVDVARDEALAETRRGRRSAAELAGLEFAAGAVAVRGPGVRVTVEDAPDHGLPVGSADLGKVQDRDLQVVVNGLWAAGAEAVSVGGYRLTSTTAIRSAGQAILVDFRGVSPPYVVEAIGPPDLRPAFLDGPGGRTLQGLSSVYGIRFASEEVAELHLPAGVAVAARGQDGGQR